jgi:hypothetical protein
MKTRAAIACFYLCLVTANAACFWLVHQMDAATFYIICSTLIGFFWGVADQKTVQRQRELDEIELMLDRSYAQERFRATGGMTLYGSGVHGEPFHDEASKKLIRAVH